MGVIGKDLPRPAVPVSDSGNARAMAAPDDVFAAASCLPALFLLAFFPTFVCVFVVLFSCLEMVVTDVDTTALDLPRVGVLRKAFCAFFSVFSLLSVSSFTAPPANSPTWPKLLPDVATESTMQLKRLRGEK